MAKKKAKKKTGRSSAPISASYLIHFYGELWNPDIIDWGQKGAGNKGEMFGKFKRRNNTHEVNFWEQRGIYALYLEFDLVYVGQVFDGPLGRRLRDHLTDRFGGRWDMFSWFGASTVRSQRCQFPGQRQVKSQTVINTLESVLISVANPPLNRKRNSIPGAVEVIQPESQTPHTIRKYLETLTKVTAESFKAVSASLEEIESSL